MRNLKKGDDVKNPYDDFPLNGYEDHGHLEFWSYGKHDPKHDRVYPEIWAIVILLLIIFINAVGLMLD